MPAVPATILMYVDLLGIFRRFTDTLYQPYNKSNMNITKILKNITLFRFQDNDNVELDHEQHEGGVVRSTVDSHPGTNMFRREHLSSLKFGSRLI